MLIFLICVTLYLVLRLITDWGQMYKDTPWGDKISYLFCLGMFLLGAVGTLGKCIFKNPPDILSSTQIWVWGSLVLSQIFWGGFGLIGYILYPLDISLDTYTKAFSEDTVTYTSDQNGNILFHNKNLKGYYQKAYNSQRDDLALICLVMRKAPRLSRMLIAVSANDISNIQGYILQTGIGIILHDHGLLDPNWQEAIEDSEKRNEWKKLLKSLPTTA